ncbi:MAG: NAD(P)H-dependent oxidoreductase subunit E, partial [Oscillibacter sp.]|nr:NAD(P)H-dependent oxidoreductase subunit E [Oscillibacter sp.]
MEQQLSFVRTVVEAHNADPSHLIAILQEIQAEFKYLSEEALTLVAELLHQSTAHVYSVATF